jgi:hypothetical protein
MGVAVRHHRPVPVDGLVLTCSGLRIVADKRTM